MRHLPSPGPHKAGCPRCVWLAEVPVKQPQFFRFQTRTLGVTFLKTGNLPSKLAPNPHRHFQRLLLRAENIAVRSPYPVLLTTSATERKSAKEIARGQARFVVNGRRRSTIVRPVCA
jgi:hypothetical protein